jgi:hypothetical protein
MLATRIPRALSQMVDEHGNDHRELELFLIRGDAKLDVARSNSTFTNTQIVNLEVAISNPRMLCDIEITMQKGWGDIDRDVSNPTPNASPPQPSA